MKMVYCKIERWVGKTIGIIAVIALFATGCGEPDIGSMQPTVEKLAAEVILIDMPPNWVAKDLTNAASQVGVDVLVAQATGESAVSKVADVVKNGRIGLCVIVCNGPIPSDIVSVGEQYPNMKFEFISDGTSLANGQNVRNLFINKNWIAYMVGYASGMWAQQSGQSMIGWIAGGTTVPTKQELQSMLTGGYTANSKATFTPLAIGLPGVSLPHVLVTDRPLTNSELLTVSKAGSVVLSLDGVQGNTSFLAWPAFLQQSIVMQDLSAFANSSWKAGVYPIGQNPCIEVNTQLTLQSITQGIVSQESMLSDNPSYINVAFASIPNPIKLSWSSVLSTGS